MFHNMPISRRWPHVDVKDQNIRLIAILQGVLREKIAGPLGVLEERSALMRDVSVTSYRKPGRPGSENQTSCHCLPLVDEQGWQVSACGVVGTDNGGILSPAIGTLRTSNLQTLLEDSLL